MPGHYDNSSTVRLRFQKSDLDFFPKKLTFTCRMSSYRRTLNYSAYHTINHPRMSPLQGFLTKDAYEMSLYFKNQKVLNNRKHWNRLLLQHTGHHAYIIVHKYYQGANIKHKLALLRGPDWCRSRNKLKQNGVYIIDY